MTSPTTEPEMQLGMTMQYAETDAEMGGVLGIGKLTHTSKEIPGEQLIYIHAQGSDRLIGMNSEQVEALCGGLLALVGGVEILDSDGIPYPESELD